MRHAVALLTLLTLLLVPTLSRAGERDAALDLLGSAGLRAELRSMSEAFSTPPPSVTNKAPHMAGIWADTARDHFRFEAMLDALADAVAADLTTDQIATLTAYYREGPGARFTRLEETTAALDDDDVLQAGRALFSRMQIDDPDRVALFRRVERGLNAVDSRAAMMLNLTYAMVSGMVASGAAPASLSEREITTLVQRSQQDIRQAVGVAFYAALAQTYRDVGTAELQRYGDVLLSPDGRAFYASVTRAMDEGLSRRARDFGRDLVAKARDRKL